MFKRITTIISKRYLSDMPNKILEDLVKKEVSDGLQELKKITDMMVVFQNKTEMFQQKSETFQRNSETFQRKMEGFKRRADVRLDQMQAEMGTGLERMAAKWLREVLIAKGVEHSPIAIKHMLKDENGLVHGRVNDLIEVDVFVSEPRTIIECTTCLEKNELVKLQKFALIKQLASASSKDGQCKAYFVTYTVEPDIQEEVSKIIEKTGIILINAEDII